MEMPVVVWTLLVQSVEARRKWSLQPELAMVYDEGKGNCTVQLELGLLGKLTVALDETCQRLSQQYHGTAHGIVASYFRFVPSAQPFTKLTSVSVTNIKTMCPALVCILVVGWTSHFQFGIGRFVF